jgi:hypothetical protein
MKSRQKWRLHLWFRRQSERLLTRQALQERERMSQGSGRFSAWDFSNPRFGATWERLNGLILGDDELSAAQTTTWIFLADLSPSLQAAGRRFEPYHVHQFFL